MKSQKGNTPLAPPYMKHPTPTDDLLAKLTDAAYQVVLRQGLPNSFVDLELAIWRALRFAWHHEIAQILSVDGESEVRPCKNLMELVEV